MSHAPSCASILRADTTPSTDICGGPQVAGCGWAAVAKMADRQLWVDRWWADRWARGELNESKKYVVHTCCCSMTSGAWRAGLGPIAAVASGAARGGGFPRRPPPLST